MKELVTICDQLQYQSTIILLTSAKWSLLALLREELSDIFKKRYLSSPFPRIYFLDFIYLWGIKFNWKIDLYA